VTERFLKDFESYLRGKGRVQIVQSSLSQHVETIEELKKRGFHVEVTAETPLFFETLYLITASRSESRI